MIDVRSEQTFPVSQTAAHVPVHRARRFHHSTAYRWAKHGVRGVRLEAIRVGGTFCTSAEALQRFYERLTDPQVGTDLPGPAYTPRSRRAAQEAAVALERRWGRPREDRRPARDGGPDR